ncbi:hypothetical protein NQ317_015446 [Molorchus minor]|uniref:SANT domain-containing protein n=1 Tax=Molorchus minor TaxID=1323400 RepID=A0ABQ9JTG5_9CUCU|nr:hypothetical protein NQ317_015446 [Molorchus minor]
MEVEMENAEDIKPDIDKLTIEIKEEPLLGSLTTFSNVEGQEVKSQQIRSSARVFKKMKLDLPTPIVTEKLEKKEDCVKQDIKKCYRPLWTSDDKSIFFEAINEFGKDFESIQMYISTKLKKKGVPEHLLKTKDQIRHLYYRSWHKISKYVKFAEGLKKVVQELYGLINYGELRKKIGSVSEKSLLKLNELIYKGSTIALRRINQLDEKYDEIKLPNRVTVELRPKDMTSFLRVQSMAQNPRLRTILPLQKRLSSLISCVSNRWKTVDARVYEKAVTSSNPVTNNCVPPNNIVEENRSILTLPLRLTPPIDGKIEKGHRPRTDSISDKSDKSPQKSSSQTEDNDLCDNITDNEPSSESSKVDVAVKLENNELDYARDYDNVKIEMKIEKKEDIQNDVNEQKREQELLQQALINNIRRDSKLILEYAWDSNTIKENGCKVEECVNPYENGDISDDNTKELDLSISLSKLLSVAKLHYRKNIIKCPCGHVCGAKNNVQLKRAMESKIRKILTDIDKCADETEDKITSEENLFENESTFVAPVYMQQNIQLSPGSYFHPPNTPMIHLVSQIDSLQRLKPRYCNRRGRRQRSKPVVVERKLPLLPNKMESGHQIVRMNIISQEDSSPHEPEQPMFDSKNVITTDNHNMFINQDAANSSSPVFPEESQCPVDIISKSLGNNEVELELDTMISASPSSPSRILKESDNQWINSEVADYSLSSLLGHLESPMKANSTGPNLANDDSRLSQDVDAQLQSLLTESSVDFSANFADLAAQVSK